MGHPYFTPSGAVAADASHPARFDSSHPMILGHRGAAGCAPENTLLSFERCIAQGADAIESDVQVTADGVPVLLHDASVERVSDGRGPVEALTRAALDRLDAGYHFTLDDRGRTEPDADDAFRGRGLRVPSVEDAFTACPAARFNLEIKTAAHDAVATVVALVARFERADRTLLTSGDDAIMAALRAELARQRVDAATSASVSEVVAVVRSAVDGKAPPAEIQALQIPSAFAGRDLVTPELVAHANRHGIAVHVWTINETDEMQRLLDLGVDGLVTDFPERAVRLRDERWGSR